MNRYLSIPATTRAFAVLCAAALAWGGSSGALAQAPQGHIASIYPAGGQVGQTVQVTVYGNDLKAAKGIHVSGGGVTGKVLKHEPPEKGKTAEKATVEVAIAADARPGVRDFRLVTTGGVTNRAHFVVGQLPEVLETEPNTELSEAQALPSLPVVVNGQVFGADTDVVRFSAKAGETIVCRVQAQRLLPFIADAVPGWFQAVLGLYDAQGNSLTYVDDFRFHPDPVLIYRVARDGQYMISIRDSIYRGREDFVYRMTLGALPYVTHIYPLGAKAQTQARVNLFGVNLPQKEAEIDLASGSSIRRVELDAKGIVDNALPFEVNAAADAAEAAEKEPNDSTEKAQPIQTPVTINGRIEKPGDEDCYVLSAEAGQKLVIEVRARRLESPMDSILSVTDADGKELAQSDDYEDVSTPHITHHADSRVEHTFAAGKYYVTVRDVQGKGGEAFAYRLSVGPPQPDFELRVTPDNPRVGQDATTVVTVHALRKDGFQGKIDLAFDDLPQGTTFSGGVIPEGEDSALVSITSSADTPLGVHTPSVAGTAEIGGKKVTRRALPAEDVMQAFIYHHLLPTQELLLTVVEPGPFKLIPQMPDGFIRFAGGRTAYLDGSTGI